MADARVIVAGSRRQCAPLGVMLGLRGVGAERSIENN